MSESFTAPVYDDMQLLLLETRELSLLYRHGFIHYTHFFVAMLRLDCAATAYCKDFKVEEWEEWLQKSFPSIENDEDIEDSPRLTLQAEHIIQHATALADNNGDATMNSVHVLLAILCFNEEITERFHKKGILFEDIAEAHFGRPVKKTVPAVYIRRKKPYSWFDKFLFNKESKEREMEDLEYNAYDLCTYGLFDDCITVCESALSLEPKHLYFLQQRIYCFDRKRDYAKCLTLVDELAEIYPEQRQQYAISVAGFHDELGQYEAAHALYAELIETDPDNPTLMNNMGFSLYLQGRYAEAVPYYEKAIALDPEFAYPHDNLGFALYKLGQRERGLELIEKALDLDRGNSFAYKYKGIIFLEEGNKEEALRNFQLALRYGYTATYGEEVLELMKKT
jgi:tetratricopeptide (TPR) repeat protein